jgi:hypothetical protein
MCYLIPRLNKLDYPAATVSYDLNLFMVLATDVVS